MAGDTIIGIASSGMHSNGFTLVRKLAEINDVKYSQHLDLLGATLGETLLTPTKIYARMASDLTSRFNIKGMANITGGGWVENIPRMLTVDNLKIRTFKGNAPVPEIFDLIQNWGNVEEIEMYSTFNMGIGFTLCVDSSDADAVMDAAKNMGEQAYKIGVVEERAGGEKDIVIV